MSPRSVTMYSRRRCGLCDEARMVVLGLASEIGFDYEEVFIDGDDALERAYGLRVPVLLVDGEEEAETHLDPRSLRALLSR